MTSLDGMKVHGPAGQTSTVPAGSVIRSTAILGSGLVDRVGQQP